MKRRSRKKKFQPHDIRFSIDHLDPLGQGVSRSAERVTFVAGTLPGETGIAEVYKRARGVQFARLKQLEQVSETRIEPECPHFSQCPGCQYLHTDYGNELQFKKTTLLHYLGDQGIDEDTIEVVPAPQRLHYRNRVQLHFRHKYIGMLDAVTDEVLEVPNCKIMRGELQPAFDALYQKDRAQQHSGRGHCELYFRSGEISVRWNENYAHGGFSQVNEDMNLELQNRVQALLETNGASRLLDLFSGAGNLSDAYARNGGDRVLIDNFIDSARSDKPVNFHKMDLYDDQTLQNFTRQAGHSGFDTLLIDPPRKGFPGLDNWVEKIKPRNIIYVSCNPASLAHDLRTLTSRFRFISVQLLDLFPATAHFETLVALQRRTGQTG